MRKVMFLKEPGHTYNILTLFRIYFNKRFFQKEPLGYQYAVEDRDYFEKVLEPYLPISEELMLFFYMPANGISFMVQNYYLPYEDYFLNGKYNILFLQNLLNNYDDVISKMYKFYFRDITDEAITECKASAKSLNKLIQGSEYNLIIKGAMLSFFIDPVPIIQKLNYELMAKDFLLNKETEKCIKDIADFQRLLDYNTIKRKLENLNNQTVDFENYEEIYVSIGINLRQTISMQCYPNKLLVVTGCDLERYADYLSNRGSISELDILGEVLCEKNRIRVLELAFQKGEITVRDVECELGLTTTNTYYHLTLMIKTGILKSRNKGRTILYSINTDYIVSIINIFKKYIQEEDT